MFCLIVPGPQYEAIEVPALNVLMWSGCLGGSHCDNFRVLMLLSMNPEHCQASVLNKSHQILTLKLKEHLDEARVFNKTWLRLIKHTCSMTFTILDSCHFYCVAEYYCFCSFRTTVSHRMS